MQQPLGSQIRKTARRGIRTLGAFTQPTVEHLTKLAQLIDAGELKVLVKRTFPC